MPPKERKNLLPLDPKGITPYTSRGTQNLNSYNVESYNTAQDWINIAKATGNIADSGLKLFTLHQAELNKTAAELGTKAAVEGQLRESIQTQGGIYSQAHAEAAFDMTRGGDIGELVAELISLGTDDGKNLAVGPGQFNQRVEESILKFKTENGILGNPLAELTADGALAKQRARWELPYKTGRSKVQQMHRISAGATALFEAFKASDATGAPLPPVEEVQIHSGDQSITVEGVPHEPNPNPDPEDVTKRGLLSLTHPVESDVEEGKNLYAMMLVYFPTSNNEERRAGMMSALLSQLNFLQLQANEAEKNGDSDTIREIELEQAKYIELFSNLKNPDGHYFWNSDQTNTLMELALKRTGITTASINRMRALNDDNANSLYFRLSDLIHNEEHFPPDSNLADIGAKLISLIDEGFVKPLDDDPYIDEKYRNNDYVIGKVSNAIWEALQRKYPGGISLDHVKKLSGDFHLAIFQAKNSDQLNQVEKDVYEYAGVFQESEQGRNLFDAVEKALRKKTINFDLDNSKPFEDEIQEFVDNHFFYDPAIHKKVRGQQDLNEEQHKLLQAMDSQSYRSAQTTAVNRYVTTRWDMSKFEADLREKISAGLLAAFNQYRTDVANKTISDTYGIGQAETLIVNKHEDFIEDYFSGRDEISVKFNPDDIKTWIKENKDNYLRDDSQKEEDTSRKVTLGSITSYDTPPVPEDPVSKPEPEPVPVPQRGPTGKYGSPIETVNPDPVDRTTGKPPTPVQKYFTSITERHRVLSDALDYTKQHHPKDAVLINSLTGEQRDITEILDLTKAGEHAFVSAGITQLNNARSDPTEFNNGFNTLLQNSLQLTDGSVTVPLSSLTYASLKPKGDGSPSFNPASNLSYFNNEGVIGQQYKDFKDSVNDYNLLLRYSEDDAQEFSNEEQKKLDRIFEKNPGLKLKGYLRDYGYALGGDTKTNFFSRYYWLLRNELGNEASSDDYKAEIESVYQIQRKFLNTPRTRRAAPITPFDHGRGFTEHQIRPDEKHLKLLSSGLTNTGPEIGKYFADPNHGDTTVGPLGIPPMFYEETPGFTNKDLVDPFNKGILQLDTETRGNAGPFLPVVRWIQKVIINPHGAKLPPEELKKRLKTKMWFGLTEGTPSYHVYGAKAAEELSKIPDRYLHILFREDGTIYSKAQVKENIEREKLLEYMRHTIDNNTFQPMQ